MAGQTSVQAFANPATTAVSATGAAAAAVTLTIPATAGVFNYLCFLEITSFASALLTAAATPVLITTTGITGTPTISFNAAADVQGTVENRIYPLAIPLRGSAVNTAMTVVCPATTGVIWRVNALYYTDV